MLVTMLVAAVGPKSDVSAAPSDRAGLRPRSTMATASAFTDHAHPELDLL